jgi:hypothetical protein
MEYNLQDLIQFHNDLEAIIEQRIKGEQKHTVEDQYESSETKDLYAALSLAQGEFKPVEYNRKNQYYMSDYADLDSLVNAIRPALCKNKIGFFQQVRINQDGMTILHTRITHATGQWVESRNRIVLEKNDYHRYGSLLNFLKRTSLESLVGITSQDNPEDDDAEFVQQDVREDKEQSVKINTKYNAQEQTLDTITKEQLNELNYELGEYPDIAEQILDGLRLQHLADLPQSKFLATINRVRKIKSLRNNSNE